MNMLDKKTLITLAVVVVVTAALSVVSMTWWTRATDQKRCAEFAAERAVSKQIVDKLRADFAEQVKRGDEAEGRAQVATQQIAGLETELAQYGAAGQRAVARQEKAVKDYEVKRTSIANSTDACVLCQQLCTEREQQSTTDNDIRCGADYCQQYCQH